MYLEKFIGKNIIIKLNKNAKEDKTLKMFYEPDSFIMNKLMGVDNAGIWLEGFTSIKRYCDNCWQKNK